MSTIKTNNEHLTLNADGSTKNVYLQNNATTNLTLSSVGSLSLKNGTGVNEFSVDGTLSGDSDDAIPTEKSVKSYVDTNVQVENDCINGTFDIWQRGTTQTTNGYGSDDRWVNIGSGSTISHTRQSHVLGQTDVLGNPKYYSRTAVTSVAGSANYASKGHKFVDVRKYSGKRVCVTFYAVSDANRNIAFEGLQNFGTSGSSSVYPISPQKVAITTSWEKYTIYIDFPSISGKTIGTSTPHSQINIWFDAGSDYNSRTDTLGQQTCIVSMSEIEVYISDKELPVRRRTSEEELLLCQTFYLENPGLISGACANSTNSQTVLEAYFPVSMLYTPTVVLGTTTNLGTLYASNKRAEGFSMRYAVTTATSVSYASGYTAEAEL